ncbi:MAG: hypothetical protein IIA61_11690 [Candidatus Marinimicrobia bacterium]|nr:hypothetical protein [Candidatus Neomarinimicrobiota bacterium]
MAHLKKVEVSKQSWDALRPDLLVLGLLEKEELSCFYKEVDGASGQVISNCL